MVMGIRINDFDFSLIVLCSQGRLKASSNHNRGCGTIPLYPRMLNRTSFGAASAHFAENQTNKQYPPVLIYHLLKNHQMLMYPHRMEAGELQWGVVVPIFFHFVTGWKEQNYTELIHVLDQHLNVSSYCSHLHPVCKLTFPIILNQY